MATYIVGIVIIIAIYMAGRHVLKVHKAGGCVGCNEKGCGCGCKGCAGVKSK